VTKLTSDLLDGSGLMAWLRRQQMQNDFGLKSLARESDPDQM
jgi:hypothetical protein